MLAFVFLAVAHSSHWQFYVASFLLGIGVGFAFASLANLIVEAVRSDQTGVATGMNAVMRTIGGALGGQVAASLLAASLLADGYPSERGYTTTFIVMAERARGKRRRIAGRPRPQAASSPLRHAGRPARALSIDRAAVVSAGRRRRRRLA